MRLRDTSETSRGDAEAVELAGRHAGTDGKDRSAMPLDVGVTMEAETLALWCHCDTRADNADLMVFLAGQLHEAKEQQAEQRRLHVDDQALTQQIAELTELAGVVAEAWRSQRPMPVDPHCTNPLVWAAGSPAGFVPPPAADEERHADTGCADD